MKKSTMSRFGPSAIRASSNDARIVNDSHSQLNATIIKDLVTPRNGLELSRAISCANKNHAQVSICGGRHAMGGQQFLNQGTLIDMSEMKNIISFDATEGLITVEAGIRWPELIEWLRAKQVGLPTQWTVAQKQTGCDQLSLGGALSANVHGRGLTMAPFVGDVESFTLITADGSPKRCSRRENVELFRLAAGGYGLFGAVSDITLRLVPRCVLRRSVEIVDAGDVIARLEDCISSGARYGDYQFAIDDRSDDFLRKGILSTYSPVEDITHITDDHKLLSMNDWRDLVYLAHVDKTRAFERYSKHYLSTNGQLYYSDTFQLSTYLDDYHKSIDARMSASCPGTELISELYVPRDQLSTFLQNAADVLRENQASVIYGTVRLIEKDNETFLPWAKQNWACTVLNLHVDHCPAGIEKARKSFCGLIDAARSLGGSYYLTYHHFATREQLVDCYPQIMDFLSMKQEYDPELRFRSNWFDYCSAITAVK